MKLTFKGVDISTEEKFVSYINSLNTAIMKQNAMNEIKQDLYDVSYLKKRYRKIVARTERFIEQLMEEEGRKDTDEQDMEANITEGKERQEHE